ncbi:helix-turn-helix domain-containing protein [Streptomyces sp. CA-106131]|uniref:helix-turn-helix domain-containing protein n=1 Tax=Streptomyces sp. CA-106131 TaxID=3240045 RepID=UPI003D8EEAFA
MSTPTPTSNNTPTSGEQIRWNGGLGGLVRPDGSVIVPAAVAGDVLRALVRDLTARVRVDGGKVAPGVRRLLYALHTASQAAEADPEHRFEHETAPSRPGIVATSEGEWLSAEDAAQVLGCSVQYARRLAASDAFTARRIGRTWLIDRTSLDTYRHGRTAA